MALGQFWQKIHNRKSAKYLGGNLTCLIKVIDSVGTHLWLYSFILGSSEALSMGKMQNANVIKDDPVGSAAFLRPLG